MGDNAQSRRSTTTSHLAAWVGIGLHAALFVILTGTCAFDGGRLAADWRDCVIPLALLGMPLALAAFGAIRGHPSVVAVAAGVGALLGFGFFWLASSGILVLVPAILYFVAWASWPEPQTTNTSGS